MLQELTIALRTLIKRPGYALSVILTLTIGIGASTMMFSLLDAAMLRPLPFAQPGRLVDADRRVRPRASSPRRSFPEVGDWRTMNQTLVDVPRLDSASLNLRIGTEAIRVRSELVSRAISRSSAQRRCSAGTFLPEEDSVPDRDAVAIISGTLWRDRFGAIRPSCSGPSAERACLRRGRRDARRVRRALVRHRRVGAVDDGVADELPRRGAGSRFALARRARPARGRDHDGACPGGPEPRGRHSRAAGTRPTTPREACSSRPSSGRCSAAPGGSWWRSSSRCCCS